MSLESLSLVGLNCYLCESAKGLYGLEPWQRCFEEASE